MSVDLTEGGTRPQTAHNCDQVLGFNLPLALLVVQGETFLELYREKQANNAPKETKKQIMIIHSKNSAYYNVSPLQGGNSNVLVSQV